MAHRNPTDIPKNMEVGIFIRLSAENVPFEARPMKEVNKTITNTSSTEAPAIISCGIPSSVPYPSSMSFNILGTTTAGETAAITVPSIAESRRPSPKNFGAKIIIPRISKVAGTKHIKTAGLPTFFKSFILRFKPALVNIIIKAICRKSVDIDKIFGSRRFRR